MLKDICPFCYYRINRRRLWFTCRGIQKPGFRQCRRAINNKRLEATGQEEHMYPVFRSRLHWLPWPLPIPRRATCPACRGRTGRHVCPHCNTPLPSKFRDSFSPVIAMAGARYTGKTVYLTVLADQIRGAIRKRFEADVSVCGDAGNRWLENSVENIMGGRRLPAITEQPDGRSEPLLFEWRRRNDRASRYRSSYLSFLDTAGEMLGTSRGVNELKFLAKVHAFIVLLDPFAITDLPTRIGLKEAARPHAEAVKVVQQVTEVLREEHGVKGMIDLPVAVVFAKVDALRNLPELSRKVFEPESQGNVYDAEQGRKIHESVREMLIDLGADDIDAAFQAHYTNFQYFAVSALGEPPDYANNKLADGAVVHPIRVSEPLIWLLAKFGMIPTRNGHA
ncbi:hypothetical protein [Actinoplanes sp. HUAS TT8]|uniref:hypothetical protein n=1 Tax=Actinoplanes sp. HUAS TT8 TaxID=3447453 RepID=UPI003F523E89